MKNSYKTQVTMAFFDSSKKNAINEYPRMLRQAITSGPSYRASEETRERHRIRSKYEEDLMMMYQSSAVGDNGVPLQIPAAFLGATEEANLNAVARKKLKLATNQLQIANLFFDFISASVTQKVAKMKSLILKMEEHDIEVFCKHLLDYPNEMYHQFIEEFGEEEGLDQFNSWINFVNSVVN